jgi:uncharacterized protein YciW
MNSTDNSPTGPDVIDQAVPLTPDQTTYAVRHERAKVAAATQGSYEAMFAPGVAGITVTERLLVALHACRLSKAGSLSSHYRDRLMQAGAAPATIEAVEADNLARLTDPRLTSMLRFTTKLIERPIDGDRQAVDTLVQAGMTTPAIVALGQLIAFLSYQIRLTAGLQAMAALETAA